MLIRFYGYWFLFYFCNYFTVIFFNTAVVACAALAFFNPCSLWSRRMADTGRAFPVPRQQLCKP